MFKHTSAAKRDRAELDSRVRVSSGSGPKALWGYGA